MAGSFRLLGALLVVGCAPLAAQGRGGALPPLAITHVTVIDGAGGAPLPDRTVVVTGGRIRDIAPSARARVPAGATIVDGRGRFLIPGLWDMHVHQNMGLPGADTANTPDTNRAAFDAMLLSHGVTGVRDMGGILASSVRWRDAVRRGELVAPRMVVTGAKLGDRPVVPGAPFPVRTADDVHRSVALLREGGADFVKVGTGLPPDLLPVAVADARQAGLMAVGHTPRGLTAREASTAGMASIEHLLGVLIASDTNEATIRRLTAERQRPFTIWERVKRRLGFTVERPSELPALISGYSEARAEQVADLFVRNHTWQTPTLRLWRRVYPPGENHQMFVLFQRIVDIMNRRGVRILAGSDAPTTFAMPGESLQEELAELVEAGLTPMQALQAATRSPAEFLGVLDSMGTIERNKAADLVLLDADPLRDIRNARRVNAVVVAGRLLRVADLDAMRARAGVPARAPSP